MDQPLLRGYLVRAVHEWCSDCGYTPFLTVRVSPASLVPVEYVKDGQIILNVSHNATHGMQIDPVWMRFSARFGGVPRQIEIAMRDVMAIYARETGEGMSFPPDDQTPEPEPDEPSAGKRAARPRLQIVK